MAYGDCVQEVKNGYGQRTATIGSDTVSITTATSDSVVVLWFFRNANAPSVAPTCTNGTVTPVSVPFAKNESLNFALDNYLWVWYVNVPTPGTYVFTFGWNADVPTAAWGWSQMGAIEFEADSGTVLEFPMYHQTSNVSNQDLRATQFSQGADGFNVSIFWTRCEEPITFSAGYPFAASHMTDKILDAGGPQKSGANPTGGTIWIGSRRLPRQTFVNDTMSMQGASGANVENRGVGLVFGRNLEDRSPTTGQSLATTGALVKAKQEVVTSVQTATSGVLFDTAVAAGNILFMQIAFDTNPGAIVTDDFIDDGWTMWSEYEGVQRCYYKIAAGTEAGSGSQLTWTDSTRFTRNRVEMSQDALFGTEPVYIAGLPVYENTTAGANWGVGGNNQHRIPIQETGRPATLWVAFTFGRDQRSGSTPTTYDMDYVPNASSWEVLSASLGSTGRIFAGIYCLPVEGKAAPHAARVTTLNPSYAGTGGVALMSWKYVGTPGAGAWTYY